MRNHSFHIYLLTLLGVSNSVFTYPVHSASTIIQCTGKIPKKTACLIEAKSLELNIYRVDLCKKNPFPVYRSSADYASGDCISLFNGNGRLYKGNFIKGNRYKLPKKGRGIIKQGSYNYLTIVFENRFRSSGEYRSGLNNRITGGINKKDNRKIIKLNEGEPVKSTTKLSNWRGVNNIKNDYCDNNGGTNSRCEINYNGRELTSIGLDSKFIESYGTKLSYMFHAKKLLSPIELKEGLDAEYYLIDNNSLEVYGNGKSVDSISIAPFIFKLIYKENKIN